MTKFAILRKTYDFDSSDKWGIDYYGGDKGFYPLDKNCTETSINGLHILLQELSQKGYIPQCESPDFLIENNIKGGIFFIKKGILSRFF